MPLSVYSLEDVFLELTEREKSHAGVVEEVHQAHDHQDGVGLVVGAAAIAGVGAFSTIMNAKPEDLARPVHDQQFFMLASINLAMLPW